MIYVFDIVGFIFGVLGAILVGNKNRYGFLGFIVGSISHGSLAIMQGNYGLLSTCLVFICIDIYYFRRWGNE